MKKLIAALFATIAFTSAYAADTCEATADQKKLAGAARTSFVKKCEGDAKGNQAGAACEATAKEKKLAGAAKSSFVKKCVADAQATAN